MFRQLPTPGAPCLEPSPLPRCELGNVCSTVRPWGLRDGRTDDRGAPASPLEAAADWSCSQSYKEQANDKGGLSVGATLGDGRGWTNVGGPKALGSEALREVTSVGSLEVTVWKGPQREDRAGRTIKRAFRRSGRSFWML